MSKIVIDGKEEEIEKEEVMDLFKEDFENTIEMDPIKEEDYNE